MIGMSYVDAHVNGDCWPPTCPCCAVEDEVTDCPMCSNETETADLCEHDDPACPRCCSLYKHEENDE